jgi:hypothetical protein
MTEKSRNPKVPFFSHPGMKMKPFFDSLMMISSQHNRQVWYNETKGSNGICALGK